MDPKNLTKEYTNGEVTVVWKPGLCIHSTICWKEATGLPFVFDPRKRPWVTIDGAPTEKIVAQVEKCPSGALKYYYNNKQETEQAGTETRIDVQRNGPLLVYGNLLVKDQNGKETKMQKVTAFCRCGLSGRKPFCDGSHVKTKIDD
jgi:uncharacterized Fe-S cluster protein YjdI